MTSSRRSRLASAARSRSSASWRRECRPLIAAASSSRLRRSTGLALMMAPMRPWLTRAVECAPVAASAKSSWTSRARTCEPLMRKSETSPPRMRLAEFSPITQRSASTRFDLPQPLGPTMPVMPGSIANSVRSTKDLKPVRFSLVNCKDRYRAKKTLKNLRDWDLRLRRHRFEHFVEGLEGLCADDALAVDQERRRRFDLRFLLPGEPAGEDLVLQRVVLEAGLKFLVAHAAKLGEATEAGGRVAARPPRGLLREQHVDEAIKALGRRAARDHRRLQGRAVEREIAEYQLRLAGVDPRRLDLRQDLLLESGAMGAGQRGVLEDGDRRIRLAEDAVVGAELRAVGLRHQPARRWRIERRGRRGGKDDQRRDDSRNQ